MARSALVIWFPIFLMAVIAILGYALVLHLKDTGGRPAILENEPDYIVHNFQIQHFNAVGNLTDVLYGKVITHYPNQMVGHLEYPVLFHTDSPPNVTYETTSDVGLVNEDLRQVVLSENVRISRRPAVGPSMLLRTEWIRYDEKTGLVTTDKPATVTSDKNRFTAQGFELDTKNDQLELFGPVNATYFRPNR